MKPKLKVKGKERPIEVSINKPHADLIQESVIKKWQEILDLSIKLFDVPNALIMRLHEDDLEVFAKSSNKENVFTRNKRADIGVGHYCETVIGNDERLVVHNARIDPFWAKSPDVKAEMVNYMGLPIKWPTGEVFGTMCILDHQEKEYSQHQLELFDALKGTIEKDLTLLDSNVTLNRTLDDLERTHKVLLEHEKNHLTNQLVSSITHEISTPIGVALTTASYIDYLTKKANTNDDVTMGKLQEGAELVQRNLEHAATLLKSFKRITTDQSLLQTEKIDLEVYVKSVVLSLKYNFRKYNVSVIIDIPKNMYIILNSGAFSQVLINLLTNATLHAFKTQAERVVKIVCHEESDSIELRIIDNGIGMTSEQIDEIFKPFVRFDDNDGGSGLGLSIVKDIVEKTLNGTVSCQSELDIGTSFILEIPKV
ncbi:MAG: GAF domain-containing sensor histidine kinase [Clostridiales bacterium]|nr:GAF domain-containing sensor histidine kinase [Clostridiales bacterium]